MPDEEQKQQPPRPTEGDSVRRDFRLREDSARDGEIVKASGARPSPNPDPDPKAPGGPVNKAVEPVEATLHEVFLTESAASDAQAEPPASPPATDSDGEGA
jgi:hypothetical protein